MVPTGSLPEAGRFGLRARMAERVVRSPCGSMEFSNRAKASILTSLWQTPLFDDVSATTCLDNDQRAIGKAVGCGYI